MSFGENLSNLRRQKGWSQDDLANNLNLSRQAVSKWENDQSKPDIDNVQKISKAFDVKIDDLLNNEVQTEKAVTLDVKKEEKKERTITIVKLMVIAVIILYVISVIYKFASLLIIVNGVQKYANLNNYHYVITTYDENGLAEKEECWFKDGVSKTVNTLYEGDKVSGIIDTYINYNEKYGYIKDGENNTNINYDEYIIFHPGYEDGYQLYSKLPDEITKLSFKQIMQKALCNYEINLQKKEEKIFLYSNSSFLTLNKNNILPISAFKYERQNEQLINYYYKIEMNCVDIIES